MLKKLTDLGARPARISKDEKTRLLVHLEATMGVLPNAYQTVLFHFGSDIEFTSLVSFHADVPSPWTSGDGMDALEMLYGLTSKHRTSVFKMFETYRGKIPDDWIPIGASSGGNQICLNVGDSREKQFVGFWDHECELTPDSRHRGGITIIASSFANFISRLLSDRQNQDVRDDVKVDLRF